MPGLEPRLATCKMNTLPTGLMFRCLFYVFCHFKFHTLCPPKTQPLGWGVATSCISQQVYLCLAEAFDLQPLRSWPRAGPGQSPAAFLRFCIAAAGFQRPGVGLHTGPALGASECCFQELFFLISFGQMLKGRMAGPHGVRIFHSG